MVAAVRLWSTQSGSGGGRINLDMEQNVCVDASGAFVQIFVAIVQPGSFHE